MQRSIHYQWAKRMKFIFTVIYGSPSRHSNSSKTFKKTRKKLKYIFMTILGLAESFKKMNWPISTRPGPHVTVFAGFFLGKYKRYWGEILTESLFQSSICAIKSSRLIFLKLCTFRQGSNFDHFQQFFRHNSRLKWKILNSDGFILNI